MGLIDQRDGKTDAASQTALGVLALCFVLTLVGRGAGESFTVFLLPISRAFGFDRAEAVSVYSLASLSMGLSSPFVGRLFDRRGPRTVYALGLALLGSGFSVAAFAQSLWQLQLCLGLIAGLGTACLSNVTGSLLLSRWFARRLAPATAVLYSASGAGVLTLVPLSQLLIDWRDWRSTYQLLGAAMLLLIVPIVLLPWRRLAVGNSDAVSTPKALTAGDEWTLPLAMRHGPFWGLFATFFFTAVGMFAISVQVVAYLIESGFAPLTAATAWGLSGVLLFAGMLTVSWLDTLIGRRRAILLSYASTSAGIAMLWLLRRHPNIMLLSGFLVCFGSTIGSRGPLITATAMNIFRGNRVGTIFGTIWIGSGLGSALGSWAGGLIHDLTHSYDLMLLFALVCVWIGMTPFLTMRALR
jgi:MFS family permease